MRKWKIHLSGCETVVHSTDRSVDTERAKSPDACIGGFDLLQYVFKL